MCLCIYVQVRSLINRLKSLIIQTGNPEREVFHQIAERGQMSDRVGYLSLAELSSSSPRSGLTRASSDPIGPSTMSNGDRSSPWATRRHGTTSNRSSPGGDGHVAGSIMSLQSISGTVPNGSRVMDQFEMIFVTEPNPRFICPACEKVMRYPVQFEECGHRCCTSCLHNIVK